MEEEQRWAGIGSSAVDFTGVGARHQAATRTVTQVSQMTGMFTDKIAPLMKLEFLSSN